MSGRRAASLQWTNVLTVDFRSVQIAGWSAAEIRFATNAMTTT